MSHDEIMSALKCCGRGDDFQQCCYGCPLKGQRNCMSKLYEVAYETIEMLVKQLDSKCDHCITRDRADAIKEFAEKVKESHSILFNTMFSQPHFDEKIDNLVKEMTEKEENEM